MKRLLTTLISLALFLPAHPAWGGEVAGSLYREIPDVVIRIPGRDRTSLRELCKEHPCMISLVYSQCGGICYPFVYQLRDRLEGIGAGEKAYRILVLSFDERDTPENMGAMAEATGVRSNMQWVFGTIEKTGIRLLTNSLGFSFVSDSSTGQLDHPPILVGVDEKGRILDIIRKFDIERRDLWQLYRDIAGEYIPLSATSKPSLVTCFSYDPARGKLSLSWGIVLLYAPVGLGGFLIWRIFTRRNRSVRPD